MEMQHAQLYTQWRMSQLWCRSWIVGWNYYFKKRVSVCCCYKLSKNWFLISRTSTRRVSGEYSTVASPIWNLNPDFCVSSLCKRTRFSRDFVYCKNGAYPNSLLIKSWKIQVFCRSVFLLILRRNHESRFNNKHKQPRALINSQFVKKKKRLARDGVHHF